MAAGALLLYLMLALAMLSPLASDAMPDSPVQDLANHVSGIIEGRNALVEGQFPIRVAPNQNNRERYPIFQFYGNLPYTVGGLLYLTTDLNPYLVWKMMVAASLILGGFFTYRCAAVMTRRLLPAICAGAVFITAPYLLTDIHARFAYPEIVSFGMLPAVFFYATRSFSSCNPAYILISAIAWSCLALSHNITYLYASVFFCLYFLLFAAFTATYFMRLLRVGIAYAIGVLLTAWYIVPQIYLLPQLFIGATGGAAKIYLIMWLTPLRVLLAPMLVVPTPPSPELLTNQRFGLQVGWPILIAVSIVTYWLCRPTGILRYNRVRLRCLLVVWVLAFFMAWTPFDFWSYLPSIFGYIQFQYRLLMFVVLWGSLLAAYALVYAFPRGIHFGQTAIIITALILFTISYLAPHSPSTQVSVASEIQNPQMGRGGANGIYQLAPSAIVKTSLSHQDINLANWDYGIVDSIHRLFYPGQGTIPAPHRGDTLLIEGAIPIEYQTPIQVTVLLNTIQVAALSLKPGPFKIEIPIINDFDTNQVNLTIKTDRYLELDQRTPTGSAKDMLELEIDTLKIKTLTSKLREKQLLDAQDILDTANADQSTSFYIHNDLPILAQLPVRFYPEMLDIRSNDQPTPYGNLGRFVAVDLPPGDHIIQAHFVGVQWANAFSLATYITVLLLSALQFTNSKKVKTVKSPRMRGLFLTRISLDPKNIIILCILILFLAYGFRKASDIRNKPPIRVTASASGSYSDENLAEKAFDRKNNTEWVSNDSKSANLTILPNQVSTIQAILFDSRQTTLFECWQRVQATLYLHDKAIANYDKIFPSASTQKTQEMTFTPTQVDRIELHFSMPVTETPEAKQINPELVHPGYSEISIVWN